MSTEDYFKPIGVDKSIVIASSEAPNLNPREESEVIKSIEKGVQSGGGSVTESKFLKHTLNLLSYHIIVF